MRHYLPFAARQHLIALMDYAANSALLALLYGGTEKFQSDPLWRDNILFYEYFHGVQSGRCVPLRSRT